ncbi:lysylphosphatidylglycerol synthase transmembrane domain-containing protein [Nibricoccus sp. IMCC34717]|uniref:lysylphosphatidylglycerol synthase transmembrane domain-containing protein n=1 Tax=Nibricoccus sp. IMCC34717 TaxID=3034021 RepID=UPI00384B8764
MKKWLLVLLGLGISVAACVWIARRTDLSEAFAAMHRLSPASLAVIVLTYSLGFLPRAYRTVFMCGKERPCTPLIAVEAVLLGYAANNVLPLRLGEIARTLFFSVRTGTARTTSLGLVAAERFLDALCLGLVLCGALLAFAIFGPPMPPTYRALLAPALLLAGGGIGAAAALIFFQPWVSGLIGRLRMEKIRGIFERVLAAVSFLRDPKRLWRVAILSLAVWLCEGGLFVGTAWALGLPNPFLIGYLALSIVNLGILIPSSPGAIGVFHAAALFALTPLGVPAADALAFALITHAIPYLLVTTSGGLIFLRHHALLLPKKSAEARG